MIRLENHVEEHEAMREALSKLRHTARPLAETLREPGVDPGWQARMANIIRVPVPPPEPLRAETERWPHLWLLVGLVGIAASSAFVAGLALALFTHLSEDEQAFVTQTLAAGMALVLGVFVIVVGLGGFGKLK